jgi:hypothetical protein
LAGYSIVSVFSGLLSPPVTLSPELMELLAELGRSIVKKPKKIDEGFYTRGVLELRF